MSANAESEAQGGGTWGMKRLDGSNELVPAKSVGTVAGALSWRQQRVPNFRRCDREAISALMPCV